MKTGFFILFLFSSFVSQSLFAASDWLSQVIQEREKLTSEKVSHLHPSSFFKHHQLVLFYASTCSHCHQFAPVLKAWAKEQGAAILAFSFDNKPMREFPDAKPATTHWVNAAFQGQAIRYPALFILNTQTKAIYPASLGFLSQEELQARMQVLIPKIRAFEGGQA